MRIPNKIDIEKGGLNAVIAFLFGFAALLLLGEASVPDQTIVTIFVIALGVCLAIFREIRKPDPTEY